MNLKLEYRRASELAKNPQNWRKHPPRQRAALTQLLEQVGWAGAVLYNERTGRLIDGHLRQEIAGDEMIPVLVGQWSEEQEQLLLATLDPITALAGTEHETLKNLLQQIDDPLPATIFEGHYDFQPIEEPVLIDENELPEQQRLCCPHCGYEFLP